MASRFPKDQLRELCLRARHVCKGGWNNPTATAAAFDRDGRFHTGDMARCDDEGFFNIVGRSKDLFISGGVNVYAVEIEAESPSSACPTPTGVKSEWPS